MSEKAAAMLNDRDIRTTFNKVTGLDHDYPEDFSVQLPRLITPIVMSMLTWAIRLVTTQSKPQRVTRVQEGGCCSKGDLSSGGYPIITKNILIEN
jgi:hypothetical protein